MPSNNICCVTGCGAERGPAHVLHSFPNPVKDLERFNKWVFAIGGDIVNLSNDFIHKCRRVCHAHFEEKYWCRFSRLSNIAVPTLNLPGFCSTPGYALTVPILRQKKNLLNNVQTSTSEDGTTEHSIYTETITTTIPDHSTCTETITTTTIPDDLTYTETTTMERCAIKNCTNISGSRNTNDEISFHYFPRDPEMREKWRKIVCIDRGDDNYIPSHDSIICSHHFLETDIYETENGIRQLTKNAVPIIEDIDSSMVSKPEEVCLLCLATDVKIYSLQEPWIKYCMDSIYVFQSKEYKLEDMPQFVCYECRGLLLKCYYLIKRSATAQTELLDILANYGEITKKLVKNVDRIKLNLATSITITPVPVIVDTTENLDIKELDYHISSQEYILMQNGGDFEQEEYILEEKTLDPTNNISACEMVFQDFEVDGNNISVGAETIVAEENNISGPKDNILGPVYNISDTDDNISGPVYINTYISDTENNIADPEDNILVQKHTGSYFLKDKIGDYVLIPNSSSPIKENKESLVEVKRKTKPKKVRKNARVKEHENKKFIQMKRLDKYLQELKQWFDISDLSLEEQVEQWKLKVGKPPKWLPRDEFIECQMCLIKFRNKFLLDKHFVKHQPVRGDHVCLVCKQRYRLKFYLIHHEKREHLKKYVCLRCPKIFYTYDAAVGHKLRHEGKLYSCPHCPYTERIASKYYDHMRDKHARGHHCVYCGRACSSANGLSLHLHTRHPDQLKDKPTGTSRCEDCDITFISENAKRLHMFSFNEHRNMLACDDPILTLMCRHCGEMFKTNEALNEHRQLVHPDNKLSYRSKGERRKRGGKNLNVYPRNDYPRKCDHCEVTVKTRMEHYWHVRKSHPSESYLPKGAFNILCEKCGKGFQNKTLLRYHERRHGNPEFACPSCPRRFFSANRLRHHSAVHSGLRYFCDHCDRSYTLKRNLEKHLRMHSDETPYECKLCDKKFKISDALNQHHKHTHLGIPWPRRDRCRKNKPEEQYSF